jgi:anti-sigma factor RsiW
MTIHTDFGFENLDDIDILAYADGLLDDDPLRKARIERVVTAHPAVAARVAAYRAQTAALRQAYDRRLAEAVPDRLYAALESRTAPHRRRLVRAAAVVVLTMTAGIAGWTGARWSEDMDTPGSAFVTASLDHYAEEVTAAAGPMEARSPDSAGRLSVSLPLPDLRDRGLAFAGRRIVETASGPMHHFLYQGTDGNTVSLFLRPRGLGPTGDVRVMRKDGVSLVYWMNGPFATALATRLGPQETLDIAETIRDQMENAGAPNINRRGSGGISNEGMTESVDAAAGPGTAKAGSIRSKLAPIPAADPFPRASVLDAN